MLPHEDLRVDVVLGEESAPEPSLRPFDREAWQRGEQQYQFVTIQTARSRETHIYLAPVDPDAEDVGRHPMMLLHAFGRGLDGRVAGSTSVAERRRLDIRLLGGWIWGWERSRRKRSIVGRPVNVGDLEREVRGLLLLCRSLEDRATFEDGLRRIVSSELGPPATSSYSQT